MQAQAYKLQMRRFRYQSVVKTRLADGTEVLLRPISPDDKPLLEEGMSRLSPDSRRLRFMAPVETLSRAQLTYLTEIDHRHHLAWGVLRGDEPVAVGRAVRLHDDPTAAEVAITVVDEYQRRGIGRLLIELLAEVSRRLGIERFTFEALPENDAMLSLLRSYGADYHLGEGVVAGQLDLRSIPAPALSMGEVEALTLRAQARAD